MRKVLDFGGNQVSQLTGLAKDSFERVIDLAQNRTRFLSFANLFGSINTRK